MQRCDEALNRSIMALMLFFGTCNKIRGRLEVVGAHPVMTAGNGERTPARRECEK